jgi:hypothetical protein
VPLPPYFSLQDRKILDRNFSLEGGGGGGGGGGRGSKYG